MAILPELVTLFLICILVMICVKILMDLAQKKKYNFPPGPTPLPLIGNMHILDIARQDFTFMELAKKYGTFFTFHYGKAKAVVLIGYEANQEALVKANYDFGERGVIQIADDFQHNHGILFSNGELWKMTRRFSLSILRDLGMGKGSIESRIIDELQFLNAYIQSHNGKPFEKQVFYSATPNITFIILFGRRFDYDNPTFKKMTEIVDDVVKLTGHPSAKYYNVFPILKYFLKTPGLVLKRIEELNEVLLELYKQARESKCEDSFRTYCEAFLQKEEREKALEEKEKIFTEKNLLATSFDLILGGTETTSTTLQWAILFMMKYPHIQKKVQDEIEDVIGLERPPRWEDQKVLPYCLAVMHEIQRLGSILQFLPHSTLTDISFRGYTIPKGTTVIPLFTSILYDETKWATPREFNPNHFLDADGKFVKRDEFFAFSKGRRVCAGESLARMELFIFFTGMLQKFTFAPPPGVKSEDLDLTADAFFTMRPKSYYVVATPKNNLDKFTLVKDLHLFARKLTYKTIFDSQSSPNSATASAYPSSKLSKRECRAIKDLMDLWEESNPQAPESTMSPVTPSDALDSPPTKIPTVSDLKTKSHRFPAITNPYLALFIRQTTSAINALKIPKNIPNNLTPTQNLALQHLQNNSSIVIKPSDKGGNVVIMDVQQYLDMCYRILNNTEWYTMVSSNFVDVVYAKFYSLIDEAFDEGTIDQQLRNYIRTPYPTLPTFYALPKTHKNLTTPPGRPIVSGCGGITENLCQAVDLHLRPYVMSLPSFIQDTPHLLRTIHDLQVPPGSWLVAIDVEALYSSIPHELGCQAINSFLQQRPQNEWKFNNFMLQALKFILHHNIFCFNNQIFLQRQGVAMGTSCAPSYANLFLGCFVEGPPSTQRLQQILLEEIL
ncbi:cytochrome P450 2W1-like [Mantella aurantiaca]